MCARDGERKVQQTDTREDRFDERRAALPAFLGVGAMYSHEQFRSDNDTNVDFLGVLPSREIECLTAFLKADEDIGIDHQSHASTSAGNAARIVRTSLAKDVASSPKDGRLRKNAPSAPTVSGDGTSAGVNRAMTLLSRSRSMLMPST